LSQSVGLTFKSKIPTLSDAASIEEALRVYHYGLDNYSGQPIPDDSIEGNFRGLNTRVTFLEDTGSVPVLKPIFVQRISEVINPNTIVSETNTIVPLTIRGASGQTANLIQFQSSASVVLGRVFSGGAIAFSGYSVVGEVPETAPSTTALRVRIANAAHKGLVVQSAASPTENLQEWQNNSASVLARVDNVGKVYSQNIEVVTLTATQTMTNKTLTSPTINNATLITLTGSQTEDSFRARNIRISTANPSGGSDGDVWIVY
jgi:hypothetical protein